MGRRFQAICKRCGHRFEVAMGGGFFFYDLRCNRCGQETTVAIRDDRRIRPRLPGHHDTEEQEEKRVEEEAGYCQCGGKFTFDAPPRCPKCRSTRIRQDPDAPMVLVD